ncbi:hypothetical protein HV819_05470 [Anaerococcus sp. AGMB00486]|uniref:Uncharacterized protein n=2 Tax=Anaerococcus TaxID=165779 RepID=A0ABX2N9R1_9FIRM|nr:MULTISPECIES: DUF6506 family protein [Anaerococcus]MDY3007378.1 DUF6506 family protein [Anaerococcus porci]MSS78322.1 hypothetical protein [Anaerococcus porci]NVF11436.1 hypothetical protein [Anaerococcus faecalis]
MKFAYIIMGPFDPIVDRKCIGKNNNAQIIGVRNLEMAKDIAIKLKKEDIDVIELCGAFEERGAKEIIKATNNEIPIGFVSHFKEQDDMFKKLFG